MLIIMFKLFMSLLSHKISFHYSIININQQYVNKIVIYMV